MNLFPTNELNNLNLALPKWPQCVVWGEKVTPEQAKEIILKTDNSFTTGLEWSGNSRQFGKTLYQKSFISVHLKLLYSQFFGKWSEFVEDDSINVQLTKEQKMRLIDGVRLSEESTDEILGVLPLSYMGNSRGISAYVGGPYGWMSVDGTIHHNTNIGKWPSTQELVEDWELIAKQFPYLNLTAVYMNGESCEDETTPIFGLKIENGKVLAFTDFSDLPQEFHQNKEGDDIVSAFIKSLRYQETKYFVFDELGINVVITNPGEIGVPLEWFAESLLHSRKKITEYFSRNFDFMNEDRLEELAEYFSTWK